MKNEEISKQILDWSKAPKNLSKDQINKLLVFHCLNFD
jgi:hypothetical protein